MIHPGNRLTGHKRSEENIRLIKEYLITIADDGDENSLSVRFSELISRVRDMEIEGEATWNAYLKVVEENMSLKNGTNS